MTIFAYEHRFYRIGLQSKSAYVFTNTLSIKIMKKETEKKSETPEKTEKRCNRTWEAMGRYQGAFTVIDPKFEL